MDKPETVLILHPDGTITHKDGKDVVEYLNEFMKTGWKSDIPQPIKIIHKEAWEELEYYRKLFLAI